MLAGSFFFKSPAAQNGIEQSVKTGGDSLGSQYAAGRDLHYHEAPKFPQTKESPVKAEHHSRVEPRYESSWDWISLKFNTLIGRWEIGQSGEKSLVVWFTKAIPPMGQKLKPTNPVACHIQFVGSTANQVSRAYWIDRFENVSPIEIGKKAGVVVGTLTNGNLLFSSYENPCSFVPDHPFGNRSKLLGTLVGLPAVGEFKIELSLIDTFVGATVAQARYSINFSSTPPVIKKVDL